MSRKIVHMAPLATISVNIVSMDVFHEEYQIDAIADPLAAYTVALPRFLELFDQLHVRATFFVSGRDLAHAKNVDALREAVARGHEIAIRGFQYARNMRAWSKLSVAEEIEKGSNAVVQAIGRRPVGFRAPGYNVDTRVLQLLAERGFKYDSSVLPSLSFYVARSAALTIERLVGKHAATPMLAVQNLRAPTRPYRPSRWAFWQAGSRKHSLPIWEIPVGLVRGAGIPVTGRVITSTPDALLPGLYRSFRIAQEVLHVELQALDLMDDRDNAIRDALAKKRTSLRTPRSHAHARLAQFFRMLQQDYRVLRMDELADELEAKAGPTVLA